MTAQEAKKRKVPAKTPKGRRPAAVQGCAAARWGNFWLGSQGIGEGGIGGITVAGAEPSKCWNREVGVSALRKPL